jgi:hypothetical protein
VDEYLGVTYVYMVVYKQWLEAEADSICWISVAAARTKTVQPSACQPSALCYLRCSTVNGTCPTGDLKYVIFTVTAYFEERQNKSHEFRQLMLKIRLGKIC